MPIFYPQVTHSIGGNTTGTLSLISSGSYMLAGGNNITLSQSQNSVTISHAPAVLNFWQNQEGGNSQTQQMNTSTLYLVPFDVGENVFAGAMTVSSLLLDMSGFSSQTHSGSFQRTMYVGIYTIKNSTQLSLLNSASSTYSMSANANNSNSWLGPRWWTFHSSQFSTQISLTQTNHILGILVDQTANSNSSPRLGFIGQTYFGTQARSGTLGAASTSHTSLGWGLMFLGVYATATNGLPANLGQSDVSKAGTGTADNFVPHFVFNNLTSVI